MLQTLVVFLFISMSHLLIADADKAEFKQDGGVFLKKHNTHLERAKKPIGLLFLGDSITEGWSYFNVFGKEVWQVNFNRYDPANFGVGGDRTEHLLWRLSNGALNGTEPRAVVLLIGTNNTGIHTAQQIAAGIRKSVRMIQSKFPSTRILLLGVLPRADSAKKMNVIKEVNENIGQLDNGNSLRFLDLARVIPNFNLDTFNRAYLRDKLHLNESGYKKLASLIRPILSDFMGGY